MTKIMAALIAAFSLIAINSAEAHKRHHHNTHIGPEMAANCPIIQDDRYPCIGVQITAIQPSNDAWSGMRHGKYDGGVKIIPNPPGTWRVAQSCAHRLAAYWGLGSGLDKVSTWPARYGRVDGPGIGVAAVRRDQHHIIGIVGGGPGAWDVVDFNSGGHLNREYTVSDFHGYFFVKPGSGRIALN